MVDLLSIYHKLPYPLRVVAASARGYYLQKWRYGKETETLIEEALERDTWSHQRWQAWQEERMAYVLHRAATQVPFYREYWQQRRKNGDQGAWDILAHWPLLNKESLQQHPLAFVADDCNTRHMYPEHTSGTSGTPLKLWWSKATIRQWYALFEARVRHPAGLTRNDKWAMLGGQLVAPFKQKNPPYWVWNEGLQQLYLSSYHLSASNTPAFLEAMHRYQITYMMGYASSMHALAESILAQQLEAPVLKVAISNAEPLFTHQRSAIEAAFRCPVRDTYGMAEIVAAGSECEAGRMHLWSEVGFLEVLEDWSDDLALEGEVGRLICTGLLNSDMPLIRYEVGDRGRLGLTGTTCPCSMSLPIMEQIEGRLDDMILTPDGRQIGRLDPVFKADFPIREAQIIQEDLNRIHVRLVTAKGYQIAHGALIIERLQDRLGDMEIILEEVDSIPRTANGKLRSVISKVSRQRLLQKTP